MKTMEKKLRMEYKSPECETVDALQENICAVSVTGGNDGWDISDFEW